MTTPFRRTRIASAVSGLALALAAPQAFGSAFALAEHQGGSLHVRSAPGEGTRVELEVPSS